MTEEDIKFTVGQANEIERLHRELEQAEARLNLLLGAVERHISLFQEIHDEALYQVVEETKK